MTEALVLDASAVLAHLLAEPGGHLAERALLDARAASSEHLITSVNWAEVLYRAVRTVRYPDVAEVVAALDALPVRVVDADRDLSIAAAGFKHTHRLGLADAYAAALAVLVGATLMTADADFDVLIPQGLKVRRIR